MKINAEIDCSPADAREFYGLPDVRELQASVLRRLEERLMARLDSLSPEAMLQNWFTFNANGAQEFVSRIFGGGFGAPAVKKMESTQP